jgi:hypothetical protein
MDDDAALLSPVVRPGPLAPFCPNCTEKFRCPPSLQVPKILPCGHCVCEGCLRVILSSTTPFCPICKDDNPLPPVVSMLTNTALAVLSEELISASASRIGQSPAQTRPPSAKRTQLPPTKSFAPKWCDDCRKFDPSLKEVATYMCMSCLPLPDPLHPDAQQNPGRLLCKDDIKRFVLCRPSALRVLTTFCSAGMRNYAIQ